jgi:hypothetical protein
MKMIHLHTATADNVGGFQDAGATLTVSDRQQAGHIAEGRARALVASHGAIVDREPAPRRKPASRKAPPRKAPAKAQKPVAEPVKPDSVAEKAPSTGSGQA